MIDEQWLLDLAFQIHQMVRRLNGSDARFHQMVLEFAREDDARSAERESQFEDVEIAPGVFKSLPLIPPGDDPVLDGIPPLYVGGGPSIAAKYAVLAAIHDSCLDNVRERAGRYVAPLSAWFADSGRRVDSLPQDGYTQTECITFMVLKTGRIKNLEPEHLDFLSEYARDVYADLRHHLLLAPTPESANEILTLLGSYPNASSAAAADVGGSIEVGHPLFESVGAILSTLSPDSEIRKAWDQVKMRSRRISKWDDDGEAIGTNREVRDLKAAVAEFQELLQGVDDFESHFRLTSRDEVPVGHKPASVVDDVAIADPPGEPEPPFGYGDDWGAFLNDAGGRLWAWIEGAWRAIDEDFARRGNHSQPAKNSAKAPIVFRGLHYFARDAVEWCDQRQQAGEDAFTESRESDLNDGLSAILESTIRRLGESVRPSCQVQLAEWRFRVRRRFEDGRRQYGDSRFPKVPSGDVESIPVANEHGEIARKRSGKRTGRKKSTVKGEARTKLIAALTKHHEYEEGSCGNTDPIGVNELASVGFADVSPSTASEFFNREFKNGEKGGHAAYLRLCCEPGLLSKAMKLLRGEQSPGILLSQLKNEPGQESDGHTPRQRRKPSDD